MQSFNGTPGNGSVVKRDAYFINYQHKLYLHTYYIYEYTITYIKFLKNFKFKTLSHVCILGLKKCCVRMVIKVLRVIGEGEKLGSGLCNADRFAGVHRLGTVLAYH